MDSTEISTNSTLNPKFFIFTWGCQMNEDDSEQIASRLLQLGCSPANRPEEADIVVLVTCSVRRKPEEKVKSKLGQLRALKEKKPHMIVGVCGCMAQRVGEELKKAYPFIDFVAGTAQVHRVPELIQEVRNTHRFALALDLDRQVPPRVPHIGAPLKAFVPVMYGCDNFCSYCIVPYVRGRERSRTVEDIAAEVRQLAELGTKEVTLVGQNVNSYGATLNPPVDFADLLAVINEIEGIERIRFTTSHPKDLSDKLIAAIRDLEKVCEHIHLPVQSGDDEVLRAMNRHYTAAHYKERVAALREAVPGIAITTDLLVGFPGETDAQFENTLRLVEEIRFDSAFMFAFNPIPGTAAATMPNQVPEPIKKERLKRLIELQNRITCEINNSQVGQVQEVLVEGVSPKDPNRLTGLTRQNKTVNFPGSTDLIGSLVKVRLTEGHLYGFVGEAVPDEE
ncbi:MAG: tRNA (N6-isopentenyl adenosine(37)-C2)-methylthiotransferase MiaB [Armatimonadota bacterium]|nr:tRNA (N6-isopentenyl adenosine(37)-C2)-methylthiotransferase MiaB [Armatimonadota bacterium]